jgi:hypothetical protein
LTVWVSDRRSPCHITTMATRRLKRPRDPIQLGKLIVDIAIGDVEDRIEDGKDPAAVELGRRGGLKGGKARAVALSPDQRKAIAEKGCQRPVVGAIVSVRFLIKLSLLESICCNSFGGIGRFPTTCS